MNRRKFVQSLAGVAGAARLPAADARPNVISISVDDMNDWVGCLGGYPGVQTPNIDGLAKSGVLFSNAHCASPLCNPSRTALMTGWSPARSGVYDNEQMWRPSLPNAVTLPMHFRANGYTAAGAGKIFHHTAGNNPPDQWDEFQWQQFDDDWYRRKDWYPWHNHRVAPPGHPYNGLKDFAGEFDWGVLPQSDSDYGDMAAVRFAQQFLARPQDKPFFLAVGLWHPHIPMYSPQRFYDMYPPGSLKLPEIREDDLDDLPAAGKALAAFRRNELERIYREGKYAEFVRAYLAAISFADHMVGEIVRAVEASPFASNTIIVFWSDNGWHLGEKRHVHKSTLWHRSTHVPLIFAGSALAKRAAQLGVTRKQPVSHLDIYPTLLELCGLPPRQDLDGVSLTPQLRSAATKRRPAVITFRPGNHAVVDERWRYIRYADGAEELYDREADPNEWRNIAADSRHSGVKQALAQWMPKTSVPPVPEREEFDFDFATHTYRRRVTVSR